MGDVGEDGGGGGEGADEESRTGHGGAGTRPTTPQRSESSRRLPEEVRGEEEGAVRVAKPGAEDEVVGGDEGVRVEGLLHDVHVIRQRVDDGTQLEGGGSRGEATDRLRGVRRWRRRTRN